MRGTGPPPGGSVTLWGRGAAWPSPGNPQRQPRGDGQAPRTLHPPLPAARPSDVAGGTATPPGARPLPKRGSGDVRAPAARGRIRAGLVSQPGAGGLRAPLSPAPRPEPRRSRAGSEGPADEVGTPGTPPGGHSRPPHGGAEPAISRGQRRRRLRHPLRKGRRCHKHAAQQRGRVETWTGISSRPSLRRPGLQRGRSPPRPPGTPG